MFRYPLPIFLIVLLFCTCKKTTSLSSEKSITAFVFRAAGNSLDSDINGIIKNDTIYAKLPARADIHHLTPTISFTGKSLNPQDTLPQDFSAPVHYTVTAEDGSTKIYATVVTYLSSEKEITVFSFKTVDNSGLAADINAVISGDTITAIVPVAADITGLIPVITYTGASLAPGSKVVQNFSIPVTYTVKAEDGSTKNYVVLVSCNSTVFIATGNFVYALNAANGAVKWKYDLGYAASSVAYHNGVIFSGGYENYLFAIDAVTGKLKWKSTHRQGVYSVCAFDKGMVFYGLNNSQGYRYMCAAGEATGAFKWEYKFLPCGYCYLNNPTAANGMVYMPDFGSGIFAFDEATGSLKWQSNQFGICTGNPILANGSVYYTAESCLLACLDAKTGAVNWFINGGGSTAESATLQDGVIYNGGYQGNLFKVYAIDTATRSTKWTSGGLYLGLSANGAFSTPAVNKTNVYANNQNGGLYSFNINDGSVVWGPTVYGQEVQHLAGPVIANSTLYTCRGDNNFYAIDATTGTTKWIFYGTSIIDCNGVVLDVDGNTFSTADFGGQN